MTAHGAWEAEFPPGMTVEFVGTGISREAGQVVSANDQYVFVRFERGATSKAVDPYFLRIVADPVPDPRIAMIETLMAEAWKGEMDVVALLDGLTDCLVGAVDDDGVTA